MSEKEGRCARGEPEGERVGAGGKRERAGKIKEGPLEAPCRQEGEGHGERADAERVEVGLAERMGAGPGLEEPREDKERERRRERDEVPPAPRSEEGNQERAGQDDQDRARPVVGELGKGRRLLDEIADDAVERAPPARVARERESRPPAARQAESIAAQRDELELAWVSLLSELDVGPPHES